MDGDRQLLSFRNPRVQHLRRLVGRRRSRSAHGQFTFEGATLLREALDASIPIEAVFVDQARYTDDEGLLDVAAERCEVVALAAGVLERVSDTSTPPGLIAVAPRVAATIDPLLADPDGWVVLLDGLRDPGNAGTIVRTVEAFGGRAVVFSGSSVDPFGPKTVRAAAGSTFRVPLIEQQDTNETLGRLVGAGYTGLAAVVDGGDGPSAVDLTGAVVLVLGNEAQGLDPHTASSAPRRVTISMRGRIESLNVAATAAVIGYERSRQLDASSSGGRTATIPADPRGR